MSKKFNLDDYEGKYVMHCKTEEEAKDFCKVLHAYGRKWSGFLYSSYLDYTKFDRYKDKTCYYFNEGKFYDLDYAVNRDPDGPYKVLEWSDFMNKEFTKDDLKNGDVVLRRDGGVDIHINGRFVDQDGRDVGSIFLNRDLSHTDTYDRDIMAVIRPVTIEDMSFDAFEKKLGRLVYERDETVEMTLEEVCKALGKNIKIVKGNK